MWLVFPDWYADILENCLFMLWRHLEYYLIHCVPVTQQSSLYQTQARRQTQLRRLQGQSSALKHSLLSSLKLRVLMSQLCGWLEGTRFTNFVIQHFRLVHVCTRYLKVELSELPLGSYIYPSLFRSVIINFNLTI